MQLRHKIKVHAVQTTDQSWRQEDNIDDRKDLDDSVLLDVYQTEERILQVVQTVKTEPRIVEKRIDIFDDHRQPRIQLFREEIALQKVRNNALFIHDILTDNSHFFLQVLDLNQQIFVHVIALRVDLLLRKSRRWKIGLSLMA